MANFREIELTRGEVAIVNDGDYEHLAQWSWFCTPPNGTREHKYAARMSKGQGELILMHRQIMQPDDGKVVDHISGDGLDNRRENLRICSHKENIRAQQPQRRGTSKYRGVCWKTAREKWEAQIKVDGDNKYLGRYKDEEQAAKAYNKAAKKHFGEYAYLNPTE
jgi:ribosomal protein L16/L10AE